MGDTSWKKQERRVAKMFGTYRTPLSGSNSRHTEADTLHDKLYIECKRRKRIAILDIFPDVAKSAKKENKIPIVAIKSSKLKDDYFLIRAKDLKKIADEII